MRYLTTFGRFWWDFVVGDDWRVALGIGVALFVTWLLAHEGANVWWLLPVVVVLVLAASLWRETRTASRTP